MKLNGIKWNWFEMNWVGWKCWITGWRRRRNWRRRPTDRWWSSNCWASWRCTALPLYATSTRRCRTSVTWHCTPTINQKSNSNLNSSHLITLIHSIEIEIRNCHLNLIHLIHSLISFWFQFHYFNFDFNLTLLINSFQFWF